MRIAKPTLIVRYGKGGISSPTSSAGYVAQATLAVAFAFLLCWEAWPRQPPFSLFALGVAGIAVGFAAKDAIAWFLSSSEERHEFVNYIEMMREARHFEQQARAPEPITTRSKVLLIVFGGLVLAIFIGNVLSQI